MMAGARRIVPMIGAKRPQGKYTMGFAITVNAIDALRVSPPPLPVNVMVEFPATAPVPALMVAVTAVAAVSVVEEKCTVIPAGVPLNVKLTGYPNPLAPSA